MAFRRKSQASLLRDNAAHQSPATHRNNSTFTVWKRWPADPVYASPKAEIARSATVSASSFQFRWRSAVTTPPRWDP